MDDVKSRQKLPNNADFGDVKVGIGEYNFRRSGGRFLLVEKEATIDGKEITRMKIYLRKSEDENGLTGWMPTEIYHIRTPGRRRFGSYAGIVANSAFTGDINRTLNNAVRKYCRD